jgi:hypothetical protein
MEFIKDSTPPDATILIPPQASHWLSTGNSSLDLYFLYPRKLVHGDIYSLPETNYDYVLISWGLWQDNTVPFGWPKENIKSKEIIYWDEGRNLSKIIYGDYVYKEGGNNYNWGVIKVK